jgi:hypothetical protein
MGARFIKDRSKRVPADAKARKLLVFAQWLEHWWGSKTSGEQGVYDGGMFMDSLGGQGKRRHRRVRQCAVPKAKRQKLYSQGGVATRRTGTKRTGIGPTFLFMRELYPEVLTAMKGMGADKMMVAARPYWRALSDGNREAYMRAWLENQEQGAVRKAYLASVPSCAQTAFKMELIQLGGSEGRATGLGGEGPAPPSAPALRSMGTAQSKPEAPWREAWDAMTAYEKNVYSDIAIAAQVMLPSLLMRCGERSGWTGDSVYYRGCRNEEVGWPFLFQGLKIRTISYFYPLWVHKREH